MFLKICIRSLGREDPLEEAMATHSSILAGKSHEQRNLVGYTVHGVSKGLDMTERLSAHAHTHTEPENDFS